MSVSSFFMAFIAGITFTTAWESHPSIAFLVMFTCAVVRECLTWLDSRLLVLRLNFLKFNCFDFTFCKINLKVRHDYCRWLFPLDVALYCHPRPIIDSEMFHCFENLTLLHAIQLRFSDQNVSLSFHSFKNPTVLMSLIVFNSIFPNAKGTHSALIVIIVKTSIYQIL
jgi:hypothetical protein